MTAANPRLRASLVALAVLAATSVPWSPGRATPAYARNRGAAGQARASTICQKPTNEATGRSASNGATLTFGARA